MIDNIAKQDNLIGFFWGAVELVLFGCSLFFLIPPVLSDIDQPPSTLLPRVFSVAAFALSRAVSVARKKRSIFYSIVEVMLFWLFSWVLFLRFQSV